MTIRTSIIITAEQRQALAELGKLINQLGLVGQAAGKAGSDTASAGAKGAQGAKAVGAESKKAARDVAELGKEAESAGNRIRGGFGRAREGVTSISQQLKSLRREVLAFFSIRFVFGALADVTRTAIEVQGLTTALKTVRGSSEAAADDLAFVRLEADRLGISLKVAIRQFVGLTAAAQGTSLAGAGVRELFTSLVEASTVLGLSEQQLDGALLAVQQIISKGKVAAEELRGQLGERLFGAFQIAARAIGLTTQELDKLLEQGLIPADRFLPAFARQLRKEFGEGVAEASKSARAQIERFGNAVTELKLQFAQSGFLDALAGAFESISKSLGDPAMKDGMRAFGEFVGKSVRFIVENAKTIISVSTALAGAYVGAKVGGVPGALIGGGVGLLGGAALAPGPKERSLEQQVRGLEIDVARALKRDRPELQKLLDEARTQLNAEQELRLGEDFKGQGNSGSSGGGTDPKSFLDVLGGNKKLARLPTLRAEFDQSAALIKDALERESKLLTEQLQDNLISIRDYYGQRERIAQASFESETQRIQGERALQEQFIASLQGRIKGADANQAAQIEDQIAAAKERIKRLDTELIMLGRQRATESQSNGRAEEMATRSLADAVTRLKLETQELLGLTSSADRRQALELQYRDLRKQLVQNRPEDVATLDRKIEIEVGLGNLQKVERDFNDALDRMRLAEQSVANRRNAGLITESQARLELLDIQRRTADVVASLVPQAKALGDALGKDAVARVGAIIVEFERLNTVADEVAVSINGAVRDSFQGLFEDIASGTKSAKEIMTDFFRSIEQAITRIAAQKFADQLFGGGSGGVGTPGSANFVGPLQPGSSGGGVMGFLSSILPFIFHDGGLAAAGGVHRRVPAAAFIGAPRLHSGGLPGLGPNELPAILERDEEVITRRDPRHRMNGGGGISVQMTVVTADANSFQHSQGQIEAEFARGVARARRNL